MIKKKTDMVAKNTVIVIAIFTLLVGWLGGYLLASNSDNNTETAKTVSNEEAMVHAHSTYELDGSREDLPEVQILVDQDDKKGWNISLVTRNFNFAPRSVNGEEVEGEGHAHLWIDGVKITRLYSNYYYLPELSEGDHEVSVTLNTNTHNDYTVDGEIIGASIDVTEDRSIDEIDSHSHTDGMQDVEMGN